MVELEWIDEGGVIVLMAKKRPYCWQPVIARIYLDRVEDVTCVWTIQGYLSNANRNTSTGVISTFPVGVVKPLKDVVKEVEWYTVRWFKGLGLEVVIAPMDAVVWERYTG